MNRKHLLRMTACALTAATLCTSTWAAKSAPTAVAPTWSYVSLGSVIGGRGMVAATVGDVTEVYATAVNHGYEYDAIDNGYYWYALTKASDSLADGLRQVFASEEFFSPIVQLRVVKVGSEQRIVLALEDGTIVQYDAATKQVKDRSAGPCAPSGSQTAFSTGDLNGDGTDEFLSICGDSSLVVHGPSYTAWSLTGVSGTNIALGQTDKDGAIELVTTSGQVIDTRAKAVQWTQSECLGSHLVAGDIDADGRDELLCGRSGEVRAYDVEKKLLKWTLPTRPNIASLQLADITGDGLRELLVGDYSELHAYDPASLADVGHVVSPTLDITNLLVADIDGDSVSELLWGAGRGELETASFLFVSTWSTKQIHWRSLHLSQHFEGPVKGDLDGDGVDELVFSNQVGSDGVHVGGRVFVLDSRTLAIRGILSVTGKVSDLRLGDVDGNGRLEILTAGSAITAHRFTRKNAFIQMASASTSDSTTHTSIAISDLDGDGKLEFIAGSWDGYVDAFDPVTGGFKWRSPVFMDLTVQDLAIGDFDKDGQLDFAALSLRGEVVHIHDGKTHAVKAVLGNRAKTVVAVESPTGPNLLLGLWTGEIQEFAYQEGTYELIDGWHPVPILFTMTAAPNGVTWVNEAGKLKAFSSSHKLRYESVHLGGPISKFQVGRQVVRLKESSLDLTAGSRGIFALPYATR